VLEQRPANRIDLVLDADRATALALVCERDIADQMEQKLSQAVKRPELLVAY